MTVSSGWTFVAYDSATGGDLGKDTNLLAYKGLQEACLK